jgi:beta-glucanase (GH16 family)
MFAWFMNLFRHKKPTPKPVPPPKPVPVPVPPPVPVPVPVPTPTPVPTPIPVPATPAFSDDFAGGKLDATKWSASAWSVNIGKSKTQFNPSYIDLSGGSLRMKLDQPTADTSIGAELISKQNFLYGIFEWTMRAHSTSPTANGAGQPTSGQISTGYIYSDVSEIDCPEIEGRTPDVLEFTNWLNGSNDGAAMVTAAFKPQDGLHRYKCEWRPTFVKYYVDDVLVATHTTKIPTQAVPVILDSYGTNDPNWGGLASVGVTRYTYFSSFKYWV